LCIQNIFLHLKCCNDATNQNNHKMETRTQRTKVYGDWGQLQGILVYNYVRVQDYGAQWAQWELKNNYFVESKDYRKEIV
jgi:hypothetical protein